MKDEYLPSHALLAKADYLVTGDEDLLALGELGGVTVVRPADFRRILRESTRG